MKIISKFLSYFNVITLKEIILNKEQILFDGYKAKQQIPITEMINTKAESFLVFFTKMTFENDKITRCLFFTSKQKSLNIISLIDYYKNDCYECIRKIADLQAITRYISNYELEKITNEIEGSRSFKSLCQLVKQKDCDTVIINSHSQIITFLSNRRNIIDSCNNRFIEQEKKRNRKIFTPDGKPKLTDRQREAIIVNEDNALVIAGAGSGKTHLILSKIQYLLKKKLFNEEDILVLAFNKAIREEIKVKLENQANKNVVVHTFHSLGKEIIEKTTDRKQSLTNFDNEDGALTKFIGKNIDILIIHNKIKLLYFTDWYYQYKNIYDFKSKGAYEFYIRNLKPINLNGKEVKSLQEVAISNFLIKYKINFEYESNYEFNTASSEFKQYQPDFSIYINGKRIYLEHFAITEQNNSFFGDKYIEGMQWKRQIHAEKGTKLIETYSYQFKQNDNTIWQEHLKKQLIENGLAVDVFENPLSDSELFDIIKKSGLIDKFSIFISTFLKHFKSGGFDIDNLRVKHADDIRFNHFLDIFNHIYIAYQNDLNNKREIDYADMVQNAIKFIASYDNVFKLIIVDEFQDISSARADLLKCLKQKNDDIKLFCVGDDWQAIYRFAGSHLNTMLNFKENFGYTRRIDLDQTFRFNNSINENAVKFITKNPCQIQGKEVKTQPEKHTDVSTVYVVKAGRNDYLKQIQEVIRRLEIKYNDKISAGGKFDLLILGRYNITLNDLNVDGLSKSISIKKLTIHSSKGLESDFVIVLNNDQNAFPSAIGEDIILSYVMAEEDKAIEFAEERRLFYVALTRAKDEVYLFTNPENLSPFIRELGDTANAYDVINFENEELFVNLKCHQCKTGFMIRRTNSMDNSVFFVCNHQYFCKFKASACNYCRIGFIDLENEKCLNKNCCTNNPQSGKTIIKCKKCETGYMVERQGKKSDFLGCSNYGITGCDYKIW